MSWGEEEELKEKGTKKQRRFNALAGNERGFLPVTKNLVDDIVAGIGPPCLAWGAP